MSYRLICGCIGLNFCIALLSFIASIVVMKRRFELFSFFTLLLTAAFGAYTGSLQLVAIRLVLTEIRFNFVGVYLVIILLVTIVSTPLFAVLHTIFAFQFLRASLNVPLIF